MVRIGDQRPLVPSACVVVAAELAAGEANQGGDVGVIVAADRLQRLDAGGEFAAAVDQLVAAVIALGRGRVVVMLGFLFVFALVGVFLLALVAAGIGGGGRGVSRCG